MDADLRDALIAADDAKLLRHVNAEFVRSSGPGGQHRNKVSSGVRLCHLESGVTVTATERRNQHENRRKALRRMRKALAIRLRAPGVPAAQLPADMRAVLVAKRWPRLSPKAQDYWPLAARILDRLADDGAKVSDSAAALGVSTASLVKFLGTDDGLWQAVLALRKKADLPPLRK